VSAGVLAQLDAQRRKLAAITLPPSTPEPERKAVQHAVAGAFVTGFRWVMCVSALFAAGSSACAWYLIGGPQPRQPP
jgi:hypothetical protein